MFVLEDYGTISEVFTQVCKEYIVVFDIKLFFGKFFDAVSFCRFYFAYCHVMFLSVVSVSVCVRLIVQQGMYR